MALDNLVSVEFTPEELQNIDQLLTQLEAIVSSKFVNLTPEQRKEYSRLGDKTENWVAKIQQYMAQYPDLVLRHIDTAEFNKDFAARQAILPRLRRLEALTAKANDTAMTLGSDIYGAAITYYKGIKVAAESNAPNAQPIYTDLKAQFPGRPQTKKEENTQNQ